MKTKGGPQYSEAELALTGGQWVLRGGIRVWDGPLPAETRDSGEDLLATLAKNLSEPATPTPTPAFCACGCWLLSADEDCPACMARVEWLSWAVKAEARHNRATFGRAA